jgi:hypothetical protein
MPLPSHPNSGYPCRRKYTYNVKLVRRDYCFTIQEVAELFGLHPNAIRRWVKAGLPTIDDRKPKFIHGSDLIDFLNERQRSRKRRCGPDEMYCCRCRAPRRPAAGRVVVEQLNARQIIVRGVCELCSARMNRGGSVGRLGEVLQNFAVTKAPTRLDETADPTVLCDLPKGA